MRIRVELDITRPLVKKKKLTIGVLEPILLRFTYERLLSIAFVVQ